MEHEGRIVFSGNEPRAKRYLSEVQEGQPPDVFLSPEIVGFNKEGTTELRNIFGEGGVFPLFQGNGDPDSGRYRVVSCRRR